MLKDFPLLDAYQHRGWQGVWSRLMAAAVQLLTLATASKLRLCPIQWGCGDSWKYMYICVT